MLELGQAGLTDPTYLAELIHRGEATVGAAPVKNPLGSNGSHAG
jgi:hypothetical protein